MSKRRHISDKTRLASALLALGHFSYDEAKKMTRDELIGKYHFDHGILHAIDPIDEFWNLTPRLISAHREKSKRDTGIVAKAKRIDKKWNEFMSALMTRRKPPKRKSRWPKRKMRNAHR